METTIKIKATQKEILTLFNTGINNNANIKFYKFVENTLCHALIRHSEEVTFKEGATYSLNGFLSRCETKLYKLKRKLSDLESKLFDERCRQNEMLERRGWGYGMRHSKIGYSTRREYSIKERIEEVKEQIKALENGR